MFIGLNSVTSSSTPTGGAGQLGTSTPPASGATGSQLNSILQPNQFLSLLVASLKYQDPLNPTNSAQFLSQLAQLSQVETLQQLSQTDSSSSQASQLANASSLIGKTVGGLDATGKSMTGTVTAVTDSTSGPVLVLGSAGSLALSAVTSVS